MPLHLPKSESAFTLPPPGMHPAICYRVIDLGTHDEPSQFKTVDIARRILIGWELAIEERMDDDRPFSLSRRYKYSGHEKSNLRKDLEAWRGRKFGEADFGKFDIASVVGAKCMLNVQIAEKDGSEYANIVGISPPVKGASFEKRHNDLQVLILEKGEFSQAVFDGLTDRLKDKIRTSPEYMDLTAPRNGFDQKMAGARAAMAGSDLDDEIPFAPEFR